MEGPTIPIDCSRNLLLGNRSALPCNDSHAAKDSIKYSPITLDVHTQPELHGCSHTKANTFLTKFDDTFSMKTKSVKSQHIESQVYQICSDILTNVYQKEAKLKGTLLKTGSFYEDFRVGDIYEFDFMIEMQRFTDSDTYILNQSAENLEVILVTTNSEWLSSGQLIDADLKERLILEYAVTEERFSKHDWVQISHIDIVRLLHRCVNEEINVFDFPDDWGVFCSSEFEINHGTSPHKSGVQFILQYKDLSIMVDLIPSIRIPPFCVRVVPSIIDSSINKYINSLLLEMMCMEQRKHTKVLCYLRENTVFSNSESLMVQKCLSQENKDRKHQEHGEVLGCSRENILSNSNVLLAQMNLIHIVPRWPQWKISTSAIESLILNQLSHTEKMPLRIVKHLLQLRSSSAHDHIVASNVGGIDDFKIYEESQYSSNFANEIVRLLKSTGVKSCIPSYIAKNIFLKLVLDKLAHNEALPDTVNMCWLVMKALYELYHGQTSADSRITEEGAFTVTHSLYEKRVTLTVLEKEFNRKHGHSLVSVHLESNTKRYGYCKSIQDVWDTLVANIISENLDFYKPSDYNLLQTEGPKALTVVISAV